MMEIGHQLVGKLLVTYAQKIALSPHVVIKPTNWQHVGMLVSQHGWATNKLAN